MSKRTGRDTSLPLLIATRFGIGIKDPAWFRHRLALLSTITAPSLLAQDDQGFEWAIFAQPDIPGEVQDALEKILTRFDGRAFLDTNGHNEANLLSIADRRGLVSSDGYVFSGRIDDDDAWDTRTVSTVRDRLRSRLAQDHQTIGFGMTFETGVVWVMYDMLDTARLHKKGETVIHDASVRPFTHPFTSISGFVYSPRAEGLTSISTGHSKIPELLMGRGFHVEWVTTDRPMWLYCRHKQTTSVIGRALEADAMDLTLAELEKHFGIDEEQASEYIANSVRHDYSWVGHWEHRNKLRSELKAVGKKMSDPLISQDEVAELASERRRLAQEFKKACENVMFRPDEGIVRD